MSSPPSTRGTDSPWTVGGCSTRTAPWSPRARSTPPRSSTSSWQYAREGLSDQIEAFAENTMTYLRVEKELLLEGVGVPDVATEIEGRHVLIVVRGYDYRSDLDLLRPYISEYRPLLIGVDGGADALIEAGFRPDMIIGDMDSCSDDTLRCGAELVVHAYHDGRAPGMERIEALGLSGGGLPGAGHQRGRGDAAGRLQGGPAAGGRRHPRLAGGVPGQGPGRHGVHVPGPATGAAQARRRQGPVRGSTAARSRPGIWC